MSLIGNNQYILQEEYTSSFFSLSTAVVYFEKRMNCSFFLEKRELPENPNRFNSTIHNGRIFKAEQPRHTAFLQYGLISL